MLQQTIDTGERIQEYALLEVRKYDAHWPNLTDEQIADILAGSPLSMYAGTNLLMYGGASCGWETLIGNGTNTGSGNLQYFNAGNSYIGTGDSNTAAAATQTDLQASTNRLRKLISSGPTHTDGVVVGSSSCVWVATFGTADANYAWLEWGLFNNPTFGSGRMFNRGVIAAGTKVNTQIWTATATLTQA